MSASDKLAVQDDSLIVPETGVDPRAITAALKENVGEMSFWDFAELSIPAGGSTAFQVSTLQGVEVTQTIPVILLTSQGVRAYYSTAYDGGNLPPDCASPDGVTGFGDPGGRCKECNCAAWSTGRDGRGQACQQRRHLLALTKYSSLPLLLNLPPTSLKNLRRYMLDLVGMQAMPYHGVVTEVGLAVAKNAKGIEYSVATFRFVRVLTPRESAVAASYRDSLQGLCPGAADVQRPVPVVEYDEFENLA